jgi:methionyl-tRNA synthetase
MNRFGSLIWLSYLRYYYFEIIRVNQDGNLSHKSLKYIENQEFSDSVSNRCETLTSLK